MGVKAVITVKKLLIMIVKIEIRIKRQYLGQIPFILLSIIQNYLI